MSNIATARTIFNEVNIADIDPEALHKDTVQRIKTDLGVDQKAAGKLWWQVNKEFQERQAEMKADARDAREEAEKVAKLEEVKARINLLEEVEAAHGEALIENAHREALVEHGMREALAAKKETRKEKSKARREERKAERKAERDADRDWKKWARIDKDGNIIELFPTRRSARRDKPKGITVKLAADVRATVVEEPAQETEEPQATEADVVETPATEETAA